MRRRTIFIAVFAIAGLFLAVSDVRARIERRNRPAFALWEARLGMPFAAYDDHTHSVSKRRFACRPFAGRDRLCELEAAGLPGTMRLLIDSTDRIVLAHFAPSAESSPLRDEARRMAAEWNLIQPGRPRRLSSYGEKSGTRWVSADGKWSAEMVYGHTWQAIPIGIGVADESAIARIRQSSPDAFFKLAAEGIVEPPSEVALTDAIRQASADARRTAQADAAAGRSLAVSAAARPVCEPEAPDVIVTGRDYATALGAAGAADAIEAVRLAYPGSRLVLGRKAYLVDETGRAEDVLLRSMIREDENDLVAFTMFFPRRAARAERSATLPEGGCRAPAEIVFAQRVADRVVKAERVQLDEEASAAQISALEWLPGMPGSVPQLLAHYSSKYFAGAWVGEIDWKAIIALDGAQVRERVPLILGKRDTTGSLDMATPIVVDGFEDGGMKITAVSADSLPLFLFLPNGPAGPPSGWMLLGLFKPPASKVR